MEIKEMVFTYTVKVFDVGEVGTPTSARCPLKMGQKYKVTECIVPRTPGDCIVFVEGRSTGVSAEYLTAW